MKKLTSKNNLARDSREIENTISYNKIVSHEIYDGIKGAIHHVDNKAMVNSILNYIIIRGNKLESCDGISGYTKWLSASTQFTLQIPFATAKAIMKINKNSIDSFSFTRCKKDYHEIQLIEVITNTHTFNFESEVTDDELPDLEQFKQKETIEATFLILDLKNTLKHFKGHDVLVIESDKNINQIKLPDNSIKVGLNFTSELDFQLAVNIKLLERVIKSLECKKTLKLKLNPNYKKDSYKIIDKPIEAISGRSGKSRVIFMPVTTR